MRKRHVRKRYVLAGAFTLGLMATSTVAFGDNNQENASTTPSPESSNNTVELPTGDTVTLSDNGGVYFSAANGRDAISFISPPALDGSDDVIVIPGDRVAAISQGHENPALYNVSALLRSGHNIARDVNDDELEDTTYGRFAPIDPIALSDNE